MRRDDVTVELPGVPSVPKKRGRPPTGEAKTAAERMAALRQRRREEGKVELTTFVSQAMFDRLAEYVQFKDMTKDEAVERALQALFRKR